jgi:predicted anti-sigma-YlaC factor YlaD
MDGEREPVPSARVDEHLRTCADCRSWFAAATELTRGLRVRPAPRTPDLTADILASVGVEVPRTRMWRLTRWVTTDHPWRAALVVVALCQLALGLGQIVGFGHSHAMDPVDMGSHVMNAHLFNESTAWNVAVGIGFLFAACRPRATTGLIPVLVAFSVLLTVFVVTDSIAGQVTGSRIASHAIIAIGVLVTVMVHRREATTDPPFPSDVTRRATDEIDLPAGARPGRRGNHLRAADDSAA